MSESKFIFPPRLREESRLLAGLTWVNPFSPERMEREREILGAQWRETGDADSLETLSLNMPEMLARVSALLEEARKKGMHGDARDAQVARSLVWFFLHHEFLPEFLQRVEAGECGRKMTFYRTFLKRLDYYWPGASQGAMGLSPEHIFACLFQVTRAYCYSFREIAGRSRPVQRLRAQVWESIFTVDLERYSRQLYGCLRDVATLVTGPTGTGKELVARAVALSQYIPFDPEAMRFEQDYADSFFPVNLGALSASVVESELFGHARGAFTGAMDTHEGYFEACGSYGAVFLDELGETPSAFQVKLLRVLQTREFQRLGETQRRRFAGKVIAATHRDLVAQVEQGSFRQDLYYRLAADTIETPGLAQMVEDRPEELNLFVYYILRRLVGEDAASVQPMVLETIGRERPATYGWPGNFRELEQCVRSVLIHGACPPPAMMQDAADSLAGYARQGLSLQSLSARYVKAVHARSDNLEATARQLEVDRRTAKRYLEVVD